MARYDLSNRTCLTRPIPTRVTPTLTFVVPPTPLRDSGVFGPHPTETGTAGTRGSPERAIPVPCAGQPGRARGHATGSLPIDRVPVWVRFARCRNKTLSHVPVWPVGHNFFGSHPGRTALCQITWEKGGAVIEKHPASLINRSANIIGFMAWLGTRPWALGKKQHVLIETWDAKNPVFFGGGGSFNLTATPNGGPLKTAISNTRRTKHNGCEW